MKQKLKKTFLNVKNTLAQTKDKLFQTNEQEINNGLFSVIKKDFFSIPISIKTISLSLFLFILGRGLGADAFFSLYVKDIVDSLFRVSLIGTILPLIKLLFALPIGELNDNADMKSVLLFSKLMYAACGILFFLAGIWDSSRILLAAVILNGIASSTLFVTYESYIRIATNHQHSENSRGLYFSSLNFAYVIGAVISSFLVVWVDLPFLYLFVTLFSILSLFTDKKIPIIKKGNIKKIFAKESFLRSFVKRVFSLAPFKKTFIILKSESRGFWYALGFEGLFNLLGYIGFLFIPLIAAKNNLSLSQIVLLFALMRLPYISNFFTAARSQRFNKKMFIAVILVFLSFLYGFLGFEHSFGGIMVLSFGISLGLSMIRPIISSLISESANTKNSGSVTGVQQFIAGVGSILGSIGFGIVSSLFGMQIAFLVVGIGLFLLAGWGIGKKLKYR